MIWKIKRIKLKRNSYLLSPRDTFLLIALLILVVTTIIIINFNRAVTPRILEAAMMKINSVTNIVINRSFDREVIGRSLDDLLNVELDPNGVINSISFDMNSAYEIARNVTDRFNQNYRYVENGEWEKLGYYDIDSAPGRDGYIANFPIGIASGNVFIANLGPRIPVRIKFVGTTLNTIESKITEYGINNCLIELFVTMSIEREVILPVQFKREEISYRLPIATKIIMGQIPEWYGGILTRSANLNVPIFE